MNRETALSALARLSRKKPAEIPLHVSLGSLGISSSFGLSALRGTLETGEGIKLPPLSLAMTVSELLELDGVTGAVDRSATSGPVPAKAATATPLVASGFAGMGLGTDLQEITSLPVTDDYWVEPFYSTHFSPEEIAIGILRHDTRAHLCGIFCAKEAAKKSHAALLNVRMADLVVVHDANGKPTLQLRNGVDLGLRFEFLISITHTALYASATCLTVGLEQ